MEELGLPLFLVALLMLGGKSFGRDARQMIIHPLEGIIKMVKTLAADPLGELQLEEDSVRCVG